MNKRKLPLQRRSRDTVEEILSVSKNILETDGVLKFSTNNIAKKAGISIGSVYQYFNSKESILMALIRRDFSKKMDHVENKLSMIRSYPFEDKIREIINLFFDVSERGSALTNAGKYLQISQFMTIQKEFQKEVIDKAKKFLEGASKQTSSVKIENTLFVFLQSIHAEGLKEQRENLKSALYNLGACYLQN